MRAAARAVRRVIASALRGPVSSNRCSSLAGASQQQAAILGIDPDAKGAVALLQTDGRVELFDSPWFTVKVLACDSRPHAHCRFSGRQN